MRSALEYHHNQLNEALQFDDYCCKLLKKVISSSSSPSSSSSTSTTEKKELRAYLWERLHSVYWKDVKVAYRDAFALVALVSCFVGLGPHLASYSARVELLKVADLGLLLGADLFRKELQSMCSLINQYEKKKTLDDDNSNDINNIEGGGGGGGEEKRRRIQVVVRNHPQRIKLPPTISTCSNIRRVETPSLVSFYNDILLPAHAAPVVLTGCMSAWPACDVEAFPDRVWSNLDNIKRGLVGWLVVCLFICLFVCLFLFFPKPVLKPVLCFSSLLLTALPPTSDPFVLSLSIFLCLYVSLSLSLNLSIFHFNNIFLSLLFLVLSLSLSLHLSSFSLSVFISLHSPFLSPCCRARSGRDENSAD